MKNTKRSLLFSILALILCVAMLASTTLAWFTDTASTAVNKIQAGTLDIEVEYSTDGSSWTDIQGTSSLFSNNLWEPGHTEFVYLRVKNAGSLALKYKVMVTPVSENGGINMAGNSFKLSDYLVFGTTEPNATPTTYTDREAARAAVAGATMGLNQTDLAKYGEIPARAADQFLALVVYMPETVGNEANAKPGTTAPFIDLGITVVATQLANESDSFGTDYDAGIDLGYDPQYGVVMSETVNVPIPDTGATTFTSSATPAESSSGNTTVVVPEGTQGFDAGKKASLQVEAAPTLAANSLFTVKAGQSAVGAIDLTATVSDVDGNNPQVVSQFVDDSGAATTVKVETYVAKNLTNVSLSYGDETWVKVDTEAEVEAGKFYYEPTTGKLVFGTTHFSTFVVHADEVVYVKSTDSAYKTIAEAFNAAVQDDVVVLLKDTATDNASMRTAASVTLDLNKKTLTLNEDLTFGEDSSHNSHPVTEKIINGSIVAANADGQEYTIGFTGGSSGTFGNVTFKSNHPGRSTSILSVYASASSDQNRYRFDSCVFDNATVSFSGAAGVSYSFDTAFTKCSFNNMKFVSGHGDSVVTFDSYVYGSAKFSECNFDITSVRNGSSAATAIRSDVLASYVGDNKLNITLNNVTIAGTTENSRSTFYPLTIRNETNANCPTVVTKTGTNTFTRNGAKATMTANTSIYSVSYLYNTTPTTEKWASVNGKLIYATNGYSKYDVVITLLEDSGEDMTLNGQKLVVPNGLSYTGTVTAATGYTLIEETGEDGSKSYASVQAEFNGKQCTIIEAQKAMQTEGSGTIKLLADGVSFSNGYKLGPNMTIDLNGHTAKNKPTPATNYAIKLENDIYSVVAAVAKANNANFASLAEAVAAVTNSNPTITLLSDCSEDIELPIATTNRVKLDANGKNYTGTVTVPEGYQLMHVGNVYAIAVVKVTIGNNEPVYYVYDNTPRATTSGTAAYAIASATEDCVMEILVDYNHVSVNGLWLVAPDGHTLTVKTNGHTVTGGVNANSGNTKVDNGDGTYTITRK